MLITFKIYTWHKAMQTNGLINFNGKGNASGRLTMNQGGLYGPAWTLYETGTAGGTGLLAGQDGPAVLAHLPDTLWTNVAAGPAADTFFPVVGQFSVSI